MKRKFLILVSWFFINLLNCPSVYSADRTTPHFFIDYIGMNEHPESHRATEDYINNVEIIAEEIWNYVIVNQGYRRPPNVPPDPIPDDRKIRIEVRDLRGSLYGEATVVGKDGTQTPRIIIDNDYSITEYLTWNGNNALRTTLIHEFFHAVQQAYANEVSFSPTLLCFWDGTAAWIEGI